MESACCYRCDVLQPKIHFVQSSGGALLCRKCAPGLYKSTGQCARCTRVLDREYLAQLNNKGLFCAACWPEVTFKCVGCVRDYELPAKMFGSQAFCVRCAKAAAAMIAEAERARIARAVATELKPLDGPGMPAPAAPVGTITLEAKLCQACGRGPAAEVKFIASLGRVVYWSQEHYCGTWCKECGLKMYDAVMTKHLKQTWWSLPTLISGATINTGINLASKSKLNALPDPVAAATK